jgi:2-keto-3-deoxy-L-rhamnonate aldolase RhmA
MTVKTANPAIADRLNGSETVVGTWVKTPSPIVCEVLCRTGLDLLVLDAEHAPFGRMELDSCIAIGRALGKPVFVRVPDAGAATILNALDCGADGILIPHVITAEDASRAVRLAHHGPGGRGYAGSTRAAEFGGRPMLEQLRRAREHTVVIAQIEDAEAVEHVQEVAAVQGLAAIFIGRVDLTVSLGKTSLDDPVVIQSIDRIVRAARGRQIPVGMFLANPEEIPHWRSQGVGFFVLGSDHGFLQSGAKSLMQMFDR